MAAGGSASSWSSAKLCVARPSAARLAAHRAVRPRSPTRPAPKNSSRIIATPTVAAKSGRAKPRAPANAKQLPRAFSGWRRRLLPERRIGTRTPGIRARLDNEVFISPPKTEIQSGKRTPHVLSLICMSQNNVGILRVIKTEVPKSRILRTKQPLSSLLKYPTERRVGARGPHDFLGNHGPCRPGALTGRVFQQSVRFMRPLCPFRPSTAKPRPLIMTFVIHPTRPSFSILEGVREFDEIYAQKY